MHLTWALLHLDQTPVKFEGEPITFKDRRPGGKVEIGVNAARRASLPLALDVPYRDLITPVDTLLRATLHGNGWEEIVFHGKVALEKKGSEEGTELLLTAVDPLAQLNTMLARSAHEGPLPGDEIWEALVLGGAGLPLKESSDQSDILWGAIASVSGHGIKKGTLTSKAISAKRILQPGESIGEAITDLCESDVAIDFEFVPIAAADGWVALNTYWPKQGTDKSATIKFVYGAGPESATDFTHSPSGEIINRVIIGGTGSVGSTRHCTVYEHLESIAKYGAYEVFVTSPQTLGEVLSAGALVRSRAFPLDFFSFSPALELPDGGEPGGFGVPPIFGPGVHADYWVGDTIALEAHEPGAAEPLDLKGRVTDATLTEVASGQLSVSLDCTPEILAGGVTFRNIHLRIPEDEDVGE